MYLGCSCKILYTASAAADSGLYPNCSRQMFEFVGGRQCADGRSLLLVNRFVNYYFLAYVSACLMTSMTWLSPSRRRSRSVVMLPSSGTKQNLEAGTVGWTAWQGTTFEELSRVRPLQRQFSNSNIVIFSATSVADVASTIKCTIAICHALADSVIATRNCLCCLLFVSRKTRAYGAEQKHVRIKSWLVGWGNMGITLKCCSIVR